MWFSKPLSSPSWLVSHFFTPGRPMSCQNLVALWIRGTLPVWKRFDRSQWLHDATPEKPMVWWYVDPKCAHQGSEDDLQRTSADSGHGWGWFNEMAMDQYLYIPFLMGWTSIYQLFWCSPGVPRFWHTARLVSLSCLSMWMYTWDLWRSGASFFDRETVVG